VSAVTDPTTGGGPDPERCPWCSSVVRAGATTCPSCGAALGGAPAEDGPEIPGVTSLDPIAAARKPIKQPNRLVSWLAGDIDPLPGPDPTLPLRSAGGQAPLAGTGPESYAPPSADVRREMARLELEAIKAELEANAPEAAPPGGAAPADAVTPPGDTDPRSPGEGGAAA
jgi:hypothetical protein